MSISHSVSTVKFFFFFFLLFLFVLVDEPLLSGYSRGLSTLKPTSNSDLKT